MRGPAPTRPQHPVAHSYLFPRARRATVIGDGATGFALDAAYSSIFMDEREGGDRVLVDGELLHAAARLRHGLGERTDVEVELPFLYTTSGFLDGFVNDWHEALGLPRGNRDSAPDDGFGMHWVADGERVWGVEEDHLGLLDIPVVLTHVLVPESESRAGLALRLGVQLPTGSESRGLSNGELDWLLGVLFERSRGRWTVTGAADYSIAGRRDDFAGTQARADDLYALHLGLEYRWNDRLSLLGQTLLTSALEPGIDLKQTAEPVVDLALGVAWDVGRRSRLITTFHEDLVSEAGPDFGVRASWIFGM